MVSLKSVKHYSVNKISLAKTSECSEIVTNVADFVVVEEPLEIWFCYRIKNAPAAERLYTTMRTPGDDINLVLGWLFTSGIIKRLSEVVSITHTGVGRLKRQATNRVMVTFNQFIDMTEFKRTDVTNSACGVCGQQSIENVLERLPKRSLSQEKDLKMSIFNLARVAEELRSKQPVFQQTGGNHGVAFFDDQAQVFDVREDVGRHNALDKLIGANLDAITALNHPIAGAVLSGRVGFEMVQKVAMTGLSYIVALGAPSSLAIDLANDCDICLIGFVKPTSCNIYTGEQLLNGDIIARSEL